MKKALLISPYWDILGGGEKHLLAIGQYLHKKNYSIELAWKDLQIKNKIVKQFGRSYQFLQINQQWSLLNFWQRLIKSRSYQAIFYNSDGSYFFSLAKKNFQLFQVPEKKLIPNNNWFNRIKFNLWTPVFSSRFTGRFFLKHVSVKKSYLLYPPVENFPKTKPKKQLLIVSVGRFFKHLHSKKQEVLIKAFILGMKKHSEFRNYRLLLIGGLKESDQPYLDYLLKLKKNYQNIEIKTNVSYLEIQQYYRQAKIYWHAAGYKINEQVNPHLVEHFGISIAEAMANYCVPVVYPAGGPKETVKDNQNGLHYHTPEELVKQTLRLINNQTLCESLAKQARIYAERKFSLSTFENSLEKMLS